MQYRIDKKSGNKLSALGFGCMRFPAKMGRIDLDATRKLVREAVDAGINYFDTAYLYAGNEEALGAVLEAEHLRDKVFIATKIPQAKCRRPEDLDRFFHTSLERLRTDHIDYLLFHNVTRHEQWLSLANLGAEEWISQHKADGSVGQMGFSWHGTYDEFEKVLCARDWDFVQIQYNYVNEDYQAGRRGLELAAERGISVIIMEPLLGGRLADKIPPAAANVLSNANREASAASWGLRWLWDQEAVTCVLSGMNTLAQLTDNVAIAEQAMPHSLTDKERAVISQAKAAFAHNFKIPCTGCNYCMPCPKGINIPGCFAAYNESYAFGWFTGVFHYFINTGATSQEVHFATECIKCGACERKCPQGIAIRQELEHAAHRLQPPGSKLFSKVYTRL